jgi:hypothetical protein
LPGKGDTIYAQSGSRTCSRVAQAHGTNPVDASHVCERTTQGRAGWNLLGNIIRSDGQIPGQLMHMLPLSLNSENKLLQAGISFKSMASYRQVENRTRVTMITQSNFRVTSVGLALLSFTWSEPITLRRMASTAEWNSTSSKQSYSCLRSTKTPISPVLGSAEGHRMIKNLDECIALAAIERSVA